jgi:hypothetical protein
VNRVAWLASLAAMVGALAGAAPAGSSLGESRPPPETGALAVAATTLPPGTEDFVPRGVPARALEDVGLRIAAPETTTATVSAAQAAAVANSVFGGDHSVREAVLANVTLDGVAGVGGRCWVVSIEPDDLWSNGVPAVFGSPGALPQKETWAFAIVDAATGAFERGMSGN